VLVDTSLKASDSASAVGGDRVNVALALAREMTGTFYPVNDDHAIERVVFAVSFDRAFEEDDIALLRKNHHLWADELPAVREPSSFKIHADTDQKLHALSAPTLEFAVLRPDGTAIWSLRFIGPEAVVECTRYTRWEKIWGAAHKHFNRVITCLSQAPARNVTKVGLVVQDAFVTNSGIGETSDVLMQSDLLPAFIFSAGPEWHVHAGRFIPCEENGRMLSNLNVDAVVLKQGDGADLRRRISVLHVLTADRDEEVASGSVSIDAWLTDRMEQFHARNKEILAQLLEPGLIARIGLAVGVST
jgi:uncharacterized protein (TIGR04255 family)